MGRMSKESIIEYIAKNASSNSSVLDVGSGGGGIAVEIALRAGCTVYGVDSSRFAVVRAKAKARAMGIPERAIFENQRAENLRFAGDFFDLVYSVKALHETRPGEALREIHRVLRKGGKLIIVDWVKGAMTWTFESYFSPRELEAMVKEAGFQLISLEVLKDILLLHATKTNN